MDASVFELAVVFLTWHSLCIRHVSIFLESTSLGFPSGTYYGSWYSLLNPMARTGRPGIGGLLSGCDPDIHQQVQQAQQAQSQAQINLLQQQNDPLSQQHLMLQTVPNQPKSWLKKIGQSQL